MPTQSATAHEGVTFLPRQEGLADRVLDSERILTAWACGMLNSKQVRAILKRQGEHLCDRLNPSGPAYIDADVDGFGMLTLNF